MTATASPSFPRTNTDRRRLAPEAVEPLTDAEWAALETLLPPPRPNNRGRYLSTDLRLVAALIRHRWRTGCTWRDLDGPLPWPTTYFYFRNWVIAGVGRHLRAVLAPIERKAVA